MMQSLFGEQRRARAVLGLRVLGSAPEPVFDRLVSAAASAFDAPMALLSLIHRDQQWVKASHGITLDCYPRHDSFCTHALDRSDVLECTDPLDDPRFAALPGVTGAPYVRYYIGAPLRRLNGAHVGVLCVVDTRRRHPASPDQAAYLMGLARQASTALEARLDRQVRSRLG